MSLKRSKSRDGGEMPMVHPNAAAIDVGATMHMAAVSPNRSPEPVRSFGTFTADLHRLDHRAAVGADHRDQGAGGDFAAEMVHRRMPVITQGDVTELQLGCHRSPHRQPYDGPQAGADRDRRSQP